jgi:hypothetical protein
MDELPERLGVLIFDRRSASIGRTARSIDVGTAKNEHSNFAVFTLLSRCSLYAHLRCAIISSPSHSEGGGALQIMVATDSPRFVAA